MTAGEGGNPAQPDDRAELMRRIHERSKDEVILDEMIRLGFWPREIERPTLAEEMIREEAAIAGELRELVTRERRMQNPDQLVQDMHAQRKKAARARRQETKNRREQARHDRAKAWHERRKTDLLHLGEEVSGGLAKAGDTIEELLRFNRAPVLTSPLDIAKAMGISLAELRFLAFDRAVARTTHYSRFQLPKLSGGWRLISAPKPRLKRAQYWVLENILLQLPVQDAAQGFVIGRSIVTNAEKHTGRPLVINLDLKDFFPSVTFPRVKGAFRGMGYSEAMATLFALLTTEPDRDEVEIDGQTWHVANGPRRLPQGAPTSPALTNWICRKLDRRLTGAATKAGYTYTRYADDLTFSANDKKAVDGATALIRLVHRIVEDEGFVVHPDKTRIMPAGRRQEVTGLVVNHRVGVDRARRRRFRALLHRLRTDSPKPPSWSGTGDLASIVHGFASFLWMANTDHGLAARDEIAMLGPAIERKRGRLPSPLNRKAFREAAARGTAPRQPWWQPREPGAPSAPSILKPPEEKKRSTFERLIGAGRRQARGTPPETTVGVGAPPVFPEPATGAGWLTWIGRILRGILGIAFLILLFQANPAIALLAVAVYLGARRFRTGGRRK